ncbi:MAG: YjbQ family protein [Actinobacteria bacterium]|nr:YjbQ family protein [Actinomycetota bacterium]
MDTIVIDVVTGSTPAAHDLTAGAAGFVAGKGDGLLSVFVPHATAGVAVLETGAGSDDDLLDHLDTLFPRDERWRHRHGSPGHGADHVMPAIVAPSITVPVVDGTLALGTWQSIVLVDPNRDNHRRRVRFSFLPA